MEKSKRVLGAIDNYTVVDIFPYKIKDISNFIFRDHVPYKEGDSDSEDYALEVWRRGIEGHWVNDNGTWVYMMPKLYFFINLGTAIVGQGKSRKPNYPDLTDIEFIIFSYVLCCDGFSGFMDDPDYTCNTKVRDIVAGKEFPPRTIEKLKKHCQKADGTWKEYVEAWEFLTYGYLLGDPRGFPLGKPLYENESSNGMIMATRGGRKTYTLAGGDCAQEMWTGGAMYVEDMMDNPRVDIFMGAVDTEFMTPFLGALELSLTKVPGGNFTPHADLTRTFTGKWEPERGAIKHEYRSGDGSYEGTGSQLSKAVIQVNKPQIVVGKRTKRIYIDECGLQGNLLAVHGAADSTLKDPNGKFGVMMCSGTGGNVEKIVENKTMYYDTAQFSIYPIPNYWVDDKPIGLFIPASYKWNDYKNENGNTDVMAGTQYTLDERNRLSGGDITKQTVNRMNEPLVPEEVFLSGKNNQWDTDSIISRIAVLNSGLWESRAKIYKLQLGKWLGEYYDVIIQKGDQADLKKVVTDYVRQEEKEGHLVIFEEPKGDGREFLQFDNLYKIVVDPKTDLETGESFHKIVVWKGLPQRQLGPDEMYLNIVAEAKIKEDGLLTALLLCLWYKCRMQYERNVSGIPDFFDKYGMRGLLLQPTPLAYIKDIIPGSKQIQQTGIIMNEQLKREGLKLLRKLHKLIVHEDQNGRKVKMVETWNDLSLLYEMNYHDDERNFDSISAMIILALWLESEFIPSESQRKHEDPETDNSWEELAQVAKKIIY